MARSGTTSIREKSPLSVIFAGAPWLQPLMRETAPDLWSVRTVSVTIQPAVFPNIQPLPGNVNIPTDQTQSDPVFALQEAEKLRGVPGKELSLARLLHRAGKGFSGRFITTSVMAKTQGGKTSASTFELFRIRELTPPTTKKARSENHSAPHELNQNQVKDILSPSFRVISAFFQFGA